MLGRTRNIQAICRDGVIADFQVTEKMPQHFVKVHESRFIRPVRECSSVFPVCRLRWKGERFASQRYAGARKQLIEEPMAAAIGAGLQVEEASGCMVVDIGGGTRRLVIFPNGVVYRDLFASVEIVLTRQLFLCSP